MFIVIPVERVDKNAIQYSEQVYNVVMKDSMFVKLFYSTNDMVLNGLFIDTFFKNINVKQYDDNNSRVYFERNQEYDTILKQLENIELHILEEYRKQNHQTYVSKTQHLKLRQQFERQYLKLPYSIKSTNLRLLIKLSGIWVSNTEYGITFKFIPIQELTLN